jgi:hypothetical protein
MLNCDQGKPRTRYKLSSRNEISYPFGGIVRPATCDDANFGVFVTSFQLQLTIPIVSSGRGLGVASGGDQDVQHGAVLVHCPPQVVTLAVDRDEHLVEVSLVPRASPATA